MDSSRPLTEIQKGFHWLHFHSDVINMVLLLAQASLIPPKRDADTFDIGPFNTHDIKSIKVCSSYPVGEVMTHYTGTVNRQR